MQTIESIIIGGGPCGLSTIEQKRHRNTSN